MITSARILFALAIALSCVPPALARTEQDVFNKLVATVAPSTDELLNGRFKPKLACVCLSDNAPGVVVSAGPPGTATPVRCLLPVFSAGAFNGGFYCVGDFVSLGR